MPISRDAILLAFELASELDEVSRRQRRLQSFQSQLNVLHDIDHAAIGHVALDNDTTADILAIDRVWAAGFVDLRERLQRNFAASRADQSSIGVALRCLRERASPDAARGRTFADLAGSRDGDTVHGRLDEVVHLDRTKAVQQ